MANDERPETDVTLEAVFRNAHFEAVPCRDRDVPGYLILLPKTPSPTLEKLGSDALASLGPTLATLEQAIIATTGCDRVYLLRLSEGEKNVHFHIFPRTAEMAAVFRKEMRYSDENLNGELLFYWARKHYKTPSGARLSAKTLAAGDIIRVSLARSSVGA